MITSQEAKPTLFYLVRPPKIQTGKPPLLILLHGVGGNEQDMFSLANSLPEKFLVVSVRGPLTLGPDSYAYFRVDFSTGRPIINEKEAESARVSILRFLEDLKQKETFDEKKVYLMGFSQGGIMSYSVALTEPEKIKGIVVMSGRLLPEIKPLVAINERLSKLKVYISHGSQDNVLQVQYAYDAVNYLKAKGISPLFHEYLESHTISEAMLKDVTIWLDQIVNSQQ
ncbi:alpha/beta hydrolase [Flavobacterium psychrotolerans]|uniref:Esterase n=1 Tax=Flavobacterium psychrotolerans TaxID=2169410 RepID=A0A2U1JQR6_9FLAO|nr:alpha/beta fold hydrolase [Flavobacterium psychrotolerans]PWA07299.1 esterase [Flavobacterium psychrotolerans]